MKKGELLKNLKNKITVSPRKQSWSSKELTIKKAVEGTLKGVEAEKSKQNLQMVFYVRKMSEEKEKKYEEYVARKAKRNMRTLALMCSVCVVSRGEE